jgi:hypothetical protein
LIWSVLRLRPVALAQGTGETRKAKRGRILPEIGRFPMHWKELFVDRGMRLHWLLRLPIFLLVLLSFVPPVLITYECWKRLDEMPALQSMQTSGRYFYYSDPWEEYGRGMNIWVRVSSGLVGTLLLVAVAARAAGSVSGERSRQTLDDLLTSPLTNREIVSAKWLGSLFGMRRAWLWLGAIYFVGLVSGGLNLLGVILAILAWFCFAVFMSSMGLWFSVNNRSTLKAGIATILTAFFVLGGHWIVSGMFCYLPLSLMHSSETRDLTEFLTALQVGVTPPAVLGFAPMHQIKELDEVHDREVKYFVCMFFGTILFLAAGIMLLAATVKRFAVVTGRTRIRRPERRSPPAKLEAVEEVASPEAP